MSEPQEEFLDAVRADVWEPLPHEWYEATVTSCSLRKQVLYLSLSDGTSVFCYYSKISQTFGGHALCALVPKGTPASVRVERRRNKRDRDGFFALECKLLGDTTIKNSRETLVISSWAEGRTIGQGIRKCGCPIFCTTAGRGGLYCELHEGDIVEANISQSDQRTWNSPGACGVGQGRRRTVVMVERKLTPVGERPKGHPWTQCREFLESISTFMTRSAGGYGRAHLAGSHKAYPRPFCKRCQEEK